MGRGVLTKGEMWTRTHTQREGHVTVEAETAVTLLQAKQRQGLLAQQRSGTGAPSQPPEGSKPAGTLVLGFQLPGL